MKSSCLIYWDLSCLTHGLIFRMVFCSCWVKCPPWQLTLLLQPAVSLLIFYHVIWISVFTFLFFSLCFYFIYLKVLVGICIQVQVQMCVCMCVHKCLVWWFDICSSLYAFELFHYQLSWENTINILKIVQFKLAWTNFNDKQKFTLILLVLTFCLRYLFL